VRNRARLVPELARRTSRLPRAELLARLDARKVPAGPVNSLADVFADPQVEARGLRVDLASDAAKGGSIPSVRSPIVIDGEPMVSPRASPRLGADTTDIRNDPNWGA
jgi:crotonobetainyl-CoA:carnitine CoA-transferase CaiB-like acyl-CoA transferase